MSDELKLNSVDRFRKRPERLVLEEYSHCEVPAGCGGVVLRWRGPDAELPFTVRLYTAGKARSWLDGEELVGSLVHLAPGAHVLAFALEDADLAAGLLAFSARHDPKEYQSSGRAPAEAPVKVVTKGDKTWKFALAAPPDGWTDPTFDVGDWSALVKRPAPELGERDFGSYAIAECARQGAACLGLAVPAAEDERPAWWRRVLGRKVGPKAAAVKGSIWVRKAFTVPAAADRARGK